MRLLFPMGELVANFKTLSVLIVDCICISSLSNRGPEKRGAVDIMSHIIDFHVHLAAIPDGKNGCYISPKMLKGVLFRFLLRNMGLSPENPARINELYIQKLISLLKESKH